MVRKNFSGGAAAIVALFVLPALPNSGVSLSLVSPAAAKMRVEPLSIVSTNGGKAHNFSVELAESAKEKEVGLMFRTHLADDQGMLFWYGHVQNVSMWMRNTYIPLDMVFIRADGTIARIEAEAEPMSERIIPGGSPVIAVLELAGGAAERIGIKPGDKVRHRLFE